uniref:Uncharacterized protein n=1 Tax=Arundo donax TaxID=35708 RepID=A0A0A9F278_ARUDO
MEDAAKIWASPNETSSPSRGDGGVALRARALRKAASELRGVAAG